MIIKNVDNILIPAHLDAQFFANALAEGLREVPIKVRELHFEWGSNPGDNYCSSIYRVLVTFERLQGDSGIPANREEKLSLIVKTIPIVPETRFLEDVAVYLKEKVTYLDVLPRLQILGDGSLFSAYCYYTQTVPVQTLVFSDLNVDGYSVAVRQNGLDWDHCVVLLRQLAKLHATSMVLAEKDPAIVKRYSKGMLCHETIVMSDTLKTLFGSSLNCLIGVVEKWPGYEEIASKLQRYSDNFESITSQLGDAKPGDRYTVLNHGDLWTTNFMFGFDDFSAPQKPTRGVFVDFQLSFYGSPACDLNFFLNTSVQLDLLKNRRDELIAHYYKHFSESLQFLRYKHIPTIDDLQYELRSRELYGLFGLFGFLPMVIMPKELSCDTSLEKFSTDEYSNMKNEAIFANDKLLAYFRHSLQRFEALGVLDEY